MLLLPKWKNTNEQYALKNDQGMKNLDNLISPCEETVSLFEIEEEPAMGLYMFDKMLRDYKKVTPNLKLLLKAKIKIKDQPIHIYIVRERISKKAIAHVFFELENKLYALIFNLEKYQPSVKKNIEENLIFQQVIELVEAQY